MNRSDSAVLITGISGQDGAWLAKHLLADGITVVGTYRPNKPADFWRLQALSILEHPGLMLRALDPTDAVACHRLIAEVAPSKIFHLAGQSWVAESFRNPLGSVYANGLSTLHLLEAIREHAPSAHLVLASSAEIFGTPSTHPQDESTPLAARSPYGVSKLLAHTAVAGWRASYGLRASSAILFNHESELRDAYFVTRKISLGVARIILRKEQTIQLGNLDAQRDFGYAPEYVAAMARMAECEKGDDFVLATGKAATIREFATLAFAAGNIELEWRGSAAEEVGIERITNAVRVTIDPALYRPVDAPLLVGNAKKAGHTLGFAPVIDLPNLARRMVEADIAREGKA